jgi:hypothetical protein
VTARADTAWQGEFGISDDRSGSFFANADDLSGQTTVAPHAHVLRRAFGLLKLDGVLCDQAAPLIYFKRVAQIQADEIRDLHRQFWNHGGAPILVLISPREVQVYSGFARPIAQADLTGLPSLVTTINRTSSALREFLLSVESGEFFRRHSKSFNPNDRVDRALLDNLQATREKLAAVGSRRASPEILDALLCRLVFTCYLFDRQVVGAGYLKGVGLPELPHLRDVLGLMPRSEAKAALYKLFAQLAQDFNGDLFSDDLGAEAAVVTVAHLNVVEEFFRATDVESGQGAFWPYDFGVIPIETISAIYERFLKQSDKKTGAFYTPRFLAEAVLDVALTDRSSLLGLRCLDPACGSGIFLVGLFNRMAEEWRRANPGARNARRAKELMQLLQSNIFGVDVNPTACRITAFSLYLAYLDQLTPRDIQELQARGSALPRLVTRVGQSDALSSDGIIWCGNFFDENAAYPLNVDLVIGNPPWGSIAGKGSAAAEWCNRHQREIPDRQIAAAFMWKSTEHASATGRVYLVLPHGILFNHSRAAIAFQKAFIRQHALDRVLNLTDYQSFLFNEARHPAIVLGFRGGHPDEDHVTEYWAPKADWKVTKAEVITVAEQDRSTLTLSSILSDLDGEDAPQIWKRMSWATPRDRRLLDRLAAKPRLRDRVRQARDTGSKKPWLIAEGFQPLGANDDADKGVVLELPCDLFIEASSPHLQLVLLEDECARLRSRRVTVRARSNKRIEVFYAPHVLVAQGFGSIAFADFAVSFRHALRGITGPTSDRKLLVFLAAYLRSSLAQYFLFHTSSNWGVSRQKVHVEELLRLPFPLPDTLSNPARAKQIVDEVARIVQSAARAAQKPLVDREALVSTAQADIEPVIYEYFDILPTERVLVEDTVQIAIPSFRPSPQRRSVPAIEPSTTDDRSKYTDRLCSTLNRWARAGQAQVAGSTSASDSVGVGLVVLEKIGRGGTPSLPSGTGGLLSALDKLRDEVSLKLNTFELARGVKVFNGNRLYIVKPLGRRHWTETAALNDADEIASSILMHSPGKRA